MDRKTKLTIGAFLVVILIVGAAYYFLQRPELYQKEVDSRNAQQGVTVVAEHLDTPWSIVFYNDIPLVSSRDTGQIFEVTENGSVRSIGKVEDATHRGEGGLLGLAVKDSYLYAYYTTTMDNRVSRFALSGERGSLSIDQPETVVDELPAAGVHNGGRIAFGPDGMLYVTVGDAGDTSSAQDKARLGGKILRMTPEGEVPTDNPFQDSLVYSYGHRNPQGIAWGSDGTMYATEFGQNTWDELNIIRPGANYGWPNVEGGTDCEWNQDCLYASPVQQWKTSEASPSGVTFIEGTLYIANLRGAVLRAVTVSDIDTSRQYFSGEYGRIRDVALAPDGTLWFVTNNTDGRGRPSSSDDRIISVPLSALTD